MRLSAALLPVLAAFSFLFTRPLFAAQPAAAMSAALTGSWRIARILPTHNVACWDDDRAQKLVGSTLTYMPGALRWSGGEETIADTLSRTLTPSSFLEEYGFDAAELGLRSASFLEYDLQHEDADVTGATTEVPGDTVLLAGPGRIVVSACGVYFSAVRQSARPAAHARRPGVTH